MKPIYNPTGAAGERGVINDTERLTARRMALAKLLRLAYEIGREDERERPGEDCLRGFTEYAAKLMEGKNDAVDAEIARVTAERDTALKDLEKCAADAGSLCGYCTHEGRCLIPDDEMDLACPDCYEWHGTREVNDGR